MLSIDRSLFVAIIAFALLADIAVAATCPPALQQPAAERVHAAQQNARDRGFLWRISKDGRVSFLYGTIHMAKFEWMFPGPVVSQALRSTDTIALEMDMLNAEIQTELASEMAALRSVPLPAALEKRMRRQADIYCVPYKSLMALTPELQVTTLSMVEGRSLGLEASYAIDVVLAGFGHGARKHMVSLESPKMQLQLLQMQTPQETIAFVTESLNEMESGRSLKMLKHIVSLWASADYAEMARFGEWCECLDTPTEREVMKRTLDQRNPALAEKIDSLHGSGKQVFAAVGSLHMFGAVGLPVLMEKRGYRVEQVYLAN